MTALSQIARDHALDALNTTEMASEARPTRMLATTFTAWRVLDNGKAQPTAAMASSLIEIEHQIAGPAYYGETILVLETATISDARTLHTYRIRRGKWRGQYLGAIKAYPHIADKLFSVRVNAFDPVEPWRCVAGADRLGVNENLIEGARA